MRSASAAPKEYSPEFEQWWKLYPVKKDKKRAYAAFKKALKRAPIEELTRGAIDYAQWLKQHPLQSGKFAEGWLNDDRWTDELEPLQAMQTPRMDRATSQFLADQARYEAMEAQPLQPQIGGKTS